MDQRVYERASLQTRFDDRWYLDQNPDVAEAVKSGWMDSALHHYLQTGKNEGRLPHPSDQKHDVSICAIVKNEGPYLLEWISFHKAVGVDHFYIYENGSSDGTATLLDALHQIGLVTKINWPDSHPEVIASGLGPQEPAYNNFLKYAHETKWVGFIDADEFVCPQDQINLKLWLDLQEASAVAINWRMFGSSGLAKRSEQLVIERFLKRSSDDFTPNRHVKTFAIAREVEKVECHIAHVRSGNIVDVAGLAVDVKFHGVHSDCAVGSMQINHYFTKSLQEWEIKRARGKATQAPLAPERQREADEFETYDRNEQIDFSALLFAEATKSHIKLLKTLIKLHISAPLHQTR